MIDNSQVRRVLWLTNTPALLTEELTGSEVTNESWLAALQKLVNTHSPETRLHITFFSEGGEIRRTVRGATTYLQLPRSGKWRRFLRRVLLIVHTRREIRAVLRVIEEVNPDLIHVFGTESVFGLAALQQKKPAIIQIQGLLTTLLPVYFGGHTLGRVVAKAGIFDLLSGGVLFRYLLAKKAAKREVALLEKASTVLGSTDFDFQFSGEMNPNRRFFHLDDPIREEFLDGGGAGAGVVVGAGKAGSGGAGENLTTRVVLHTTIHEEYYKGLDLLFRTAFLLEQTGVNFKWQIAGLNETSKMVKIYSELFREIDLVNMSLNEDVGKKHSEDMVSFKVSGEFQEKTGFIGKTETKISEEKAGNLPFWDRIIFLGRIGSGELCNAMKDADIYVHTSYIENPSNAICEAQCLGLPVIGANAGGTSSIIEDGKTGLLYKKGDHKELAGLIIKLIENGDLRRQIAENGRKTALKRHNNTEIVNRLLQIYSEVSGVNFSSGKDTQPASIPKE